jgi:hypothetical protein
VPFTSLRRPAPRAPALTAEAQPALSPVRYTLLNGGPGIGSLKHLGKTATLQAFGKRGWAKLHLCDSGELISWRVKHMAALPEVQA